MACIRVLAILAVIGLKARCPIALYLSAYFAILFAHYLLSFWYAGGRVRRLYHDASHYKSLFLLAVIILGAVRSFFPPLVICFAFHHAFTEGYMADSILQGKRTALVAVRILLNLWIFGLLLWDVEPLFQIFPKAFWISGSLFFFAELLAGLKVARPCLPPRQALDLLFFEAAGLLGGLFLPRPVQFYDVVFYHVCVWILLPLHDLGSRGLRPAMVFAGQSAGLAVILFLMTPYSRLIPQRGFAVWKYQSEVWGYIHILASLALSGYNPDWIRRLFNQVAST